MRKKQRTPNQVVAAFIRSDRSIQADMLIDVARVLNRENYGSVGSMTSLLTKALHGNKLFEYTSEEGHNYYETMKARRRRLGVPKSVRNSKVRSMSAKALA